MTSEVARWKGGGGGAAGPTAGNNGSARYKLVASWERILAEVAEPVDKATGTAGGAGGAANAGTTGVGPRFQSRRCRDRVRFFHRIRRRR